MAYTVETSTGDEVAWAETLAEATERARNALEGDPEMGSLDVYEHAGDGVTARLARTVTFGPDADWQSVVVVLEPGERVEPPNVVAIREDGRYRYEEDTDAYDPSDPKHPHFHSVHADLWDNRAGK